MKIARKLVLSLIALISLVACFSVSTYAWFKVNSEAKVEGFQFEVTGGLGFMVSVDGTSFTNSLSSRQLKMSILRGYSDKYIIENNELYEVKADKTRVRLNESQIDKLVNETFKLLPITSKNGSTFQNKNGTEIGNEFKDQYITFDVYFRATSKNPNDMIEYDIYLCGDDVRQPNGNIIEGTRITSPIDTIDLAADMTIYDGSILGPGRDRKTIDVKTSNALRLSIQDTTLEQPKNATIYELTDKDTDKYDLGSYATNYKKPTDIEASDEERELDRLYNSEINAMFTYYNNLRKQSPMDPMPFEDKPETVRDLTDETIITTVSPTSGVKKATFRIWLEGWDADCFDGLTSSVNVRLMFKSKSRTLAE